MSEPPKETNTVHLPNGFVDLMLVLGLDDNTGLIPTPNTQVVGHHKTFFKQLLTEEYEAQVLAAISASAMVYFHPVVHRDPHYPPCLDVHHQMHQSRPVHNSHIIRSTSITPAMVSRHISFTIQPSKKNTQLTVPELPLSEEDIKALTTFCFPDGVHVYSHKPSSYVHHLVLTDMDGAKTYATCLTFHRGFLVEKDDREGSLYIQLALAESEKRKNQDLCYLPQCCVLVSKYPYFSTMRECLSCLVAHIEKDPEEMYSFVKETTRILTMAPVPTSGNVVVEFPLYQSLIALYPPDWPDKLVIDIPLHLVFVCIPKDVVLLIITAILSEERIVFLSSRYALLTIVMESFLNFILPFRWRFTYVPILSSQSLELVEAPGTFMMGCHSQHEWDILQVEGLVVVHIDKGTVVLTEDPSDPEADRIPTMPSEAAAIFISVYDRAKLQFDVLEVERPVFYDMEKEKQFRAKKIQQFNSDITYGCLELMINLFRSVVLELRVQHQHFDKEAFLSNRSEADEPFYKKVLRTDMFKNFLSDRMQEKSDYWSDLEVKTRQYVKNVTTLIEATSVPNRRAMKKDVTVSMFAPPVSHKEMTIFSLPSIHASRSYIADTITALTRALDGCSDYEERGSYLYLRGMMFISDDNSEAALEDLMSLAGTNHRLLPMKLLRGMMKKLPDISIMSIAKTQSFNYLCELLSIDKGEGDRHWHPPSFKIPDRDMSYDEFVDIISLHEMTNDADMAHRLFKALTVFKQQPYVEQKTFEVFYQCWQDNKSQCGNVKIFSEKLQEDENILKVSSLIKTDLGMGRIVLTDKRLFFLKDVSSDYQNIIQLRDIKSIERLQLFSFLSTVDALRIHCRDGSSPFTAWLKEDRNWWYLLVQEMWSGKVVAEGMRDINAVHQAAQNVLLIDAVIRSGQEECTAHFASVQDVATYLCYYTHYKQNNRHKLPVDTIQALQNRIDPNMEQKDRKSVQALLYTPGDGAVLPRLWCGMVDGKVRVFDARTWNLEVEFIQTKSTIACLTAVGDQIWAGSHGIFIIDTETVTCTKTLMEHQDLVTDIAVTDDNRSTYTASLDGVIIEWETQKLIIRKRISIGDVKTLRSIKIFEDKIYCGSWQNIWVLDKSGFVVQKLQFEDSSNPSRITQLDCFQVVNNEIWAGCRRDGKLIIWDCHSGKVIETITIDCRGISTMILQESKMWVGTKHGTIHIFNLGNRTVWKVLHAHSDAVRCLCCAEDRYVMSGAGSKDGKIAIWSSSCNETDSGKYVLDDDDL